jgi:hypothetical protein
MTQPHLQCQELFSVTPVSRPVEMAPPETTLQRSPRYPFTRADDVAVAYPLNQEGWGGSIPTSALQLRFHRIGFDTARQLVTLWHSRLPEIYSGAAGGGYYHVNYVAEFAEGWYAAAIWTSPIALNRMSVVDPLEVIELRRLAICAMAPRNTASRMLAFMARDLFRSEPTLQRLISYQDTAVHDGTIYKAAGWTARDSSRFQTWNTSRTDRSNRAIQQAASPKRRWEKRRDVTKQPV